MLQILTGLNYLHSQNIIHRDLKGANILISNDGLVKIIDFGLARHLDPENRNKNYTREVVTMWFRSPELIYGMRNYTLAVDIWSLGCIFAELILKEGQAFFKSNG